MDKNIKVSEKKADIIKMLRYAVAALSIVSFMTTLNGIQGIVTNSLFFAGLISFGIQAVILVIGLWFVNALVTVRKQQIAVFMKILAIGLMIILYISSMIFSSFFSFVYLSNVAYADVRPTDYNMELEKFLVENTKEIKNINDAVSDILLQRIRKTAPKFRQLAENYQDVINNEIENILNGRIKYNASVIPAEARFSAQDAITAYAGVHPGEEIDERLKEDCERLERDINNYITFYDEQYYPAYSQFYDEMATHLNISEIESQKSSIENVIDSMERQITLLSNYGYSYYSIEDYVKSRCSDIITRYNFLISHLKEIIYTYDEISSHTNIFQSDNSTLQGFYESIYSADIMSEQELLNSMTQLQQIVSEYINNIENLDEKTITNLSTCIEYLDQLNQCKKLKERIELFEIDNLGATYIVNDSNTYQVEGSANDTSSYYLVSEDEWSKIRHRDIAEFISLLKNLPDFELLLSANDNDENIDTSDDSNHLYLTQKFENNYVSHTLDKAYEYNRAKLENISDMERASNYLFSENSFLAKFCLLIAVFLDGASLLIGLFIYVCEINNKNRGQSPNQGADTTRDAVEEH